MLKIVLGVAMSDIKRVGECIDSNDFHTIELFFLLIVPESNIPGVWTEKNRLTLVFLCC